MTILCRLFGCKILRDYRGRIHPHYVLECTRCGRSPDDHKPHDYNWMQDAPEPKPRKGFFK